MSLSGNPVNHLCAALCHKTGLLTFSDSFMTSPDGTTLVEVEEIIHNTAIKVCDSVMKTYWHLYDNSTLSHFT